MSDTQTEQATPASADDGVISRIVERDIAVPLTDKDHSDFMKKAADFYKERCDLEIEKKKAVTGFNEKIAEKDAEISKIMESVLLGESIQFRSVKEVRDYNLCSVKLFVNDQLVEERAMEGDEFQRDLFLRQQETATDQLQELNSELPVSEPADAAKDLKDVMREETHAVTKHTEVDGPRA